MSDGDVGSNRVSLWWFQRRYGVGLHRSAAGLSPRIILVIAVSAQTRKTPQITVHGVAFPVCIYRKREIVQVMHVYCIVSVRLGGQSAAKRAKERLVRKEDTIAPINVCVC